MEMSDTRDGLGVRREGRECDAGSGRSAAPNLSERSNAERVDEGDAREVNDERLSAAREGCLRVAKKSARRGRIEAGTLYLKASYFGKCVSSSHAASAKHLACRTLPDRSARCGIFAAHIGAMFSRLLVLALSASLTACGASLPDAPLYATDDASFEKVEVPEPPGLPSDPPRPMTLLPGDIVAIRVLSQDPMESAGLVVDEKGALPIPLAGEVPVGGLTLAAARKAIEESIQQYDKFARAVVTVTEAAGHRATVVGAVEKPGAYILRPDMRVAELVAITGGPKVAVSDGDSMALADLGAARVVRGGVMLPVSVGRALEGDPRHNVRVAPGDLIFLPASRGQRISVLGEVQKPTSVPYYRGLRLTEAVARAGGATDDADNGDIRVIRGPLSKPKVYTASIKALRNGDGRDVLLEPGDVVYVTEHWYATTGNVLQRLTPILAAAAVGAAFYARPAGE